MYNTEINMWTSGLAQFLDELDKDFQENEKETNALISELTKQLYPMFCSRRTEHTIYGRRFKEPILEDERGSYEERSE